jgi:hypothetical protein
VSTTQLAQKSFLSNESAPHPYTYVLPISSVSGTQVKSIKCRIDRGIFLMQNELVLIRHRPISTLRLDRLSRSLPFSIPKLPSFSLPMFLVKLFKGNILSRKRDLSKSREQVEIPSIVGPYHIEHVVAVAAKHPYYSSNDIYPLPPDQISRIMQTGTSSFDVVSLLSKFPVSQKEDM